MTQFEQWDIISGVGVTALAVALARAIETNRPDGIANDPLAASFLDAVELPPPFDIWPTVSEGVAAEPASWWDSLPAYMGARTRFFDEFFAATSAAGIRQVVLLAAGLDTRAYRLSWPDGIRVFEVDQALVMSFKEEVLGTQGLRSGCERVVVPADLREDWGAALQESGFDAGRPTAWLAEGLLSFLSADTERDMFAGVRKLSASGSRFAVEAVSGSVRHLSHTTPPAFGWQEHVGVEVAKLWNPETRPEPIEVLREAGWTVTMEKVAEAAARYGRSVDGLMRIPAEHSQLLDASLD